jgi:hypothetical protein
LSASAGCVDKRERPQLLFETGSLKQSEWKQVDKTCEYEVAKAVAPIKIGIIATEQYRKLYVLCAEARGAVFIGSTDKVKTSGPNVVAVQPYFWN